MNDQKLQLALAKRLPDEIEVREPYMHFYWKKWKGHCVRDTEWLHVCWLVEQKMEQGEFERYRHILGAVCYDKSFIKHTHNWQSASWQQRAEAILKVKGVVR